MCRFDSGQKATWAAENDEENYEALTPYQETRLWHLRSDEGLCQHRESVRAAPVALVWKSHICPCAAFVCTYRPLDLCSGEEKSIMTCTHPTQLANLKNDSVRICTYFVALTL